VRDGKLVIKDGDDKPHRDKHVRDDRPHRRQSESDLTDVARSRGSPDFPKWMADNTDSFFVPETSPQIKQWGAHLMYSTSMQALFECNIAVTETDFREELKRIDVPVLILHGTQDVSAPLPLTGQPTAQLIRGAELKVYEGAPHGIFVTHLERVNQDLLRLIRS
jgi:non-heme chloroperoxidase